jgi:hypothetical protein
MRALLLLKESLRHERRVVKSVGRVSHSQDRWSFDRRLRDFDAH